MTDERTAWRAWAVWLGGTLGTFAVLEAAAVKADRTDLTLSGTMRMALGIQPARPWGRLAGAAFAAGCVVLASHVVLGRP